KVGCPIAPKTPKWGVPFSPETFPPPVGPPLAILGGGGCGAHFGGRVFPHNQPHTLRPCPPLILCPPSQLDPLEEDPVGQIVLVETIPEGMTFGEGSPSNPSTFFTWMNLLATVNRSLDIASFYWTMTNEDTGTHQPSAAQVGSRSPEFPAVGWEGNPLEMVSSRAGPTGRCLRGVWEVSRDEDPTTSLGSLFQGAAVRTVDLPQLTGGVLHTKLWLVDGAHLYVGSANMDWRSLTQVKELGAAVYNCSCLAKDLGKIFEAYWALGIPGASIPAPWPANYSTAFNMETPLELKLNDTDSASSPPALCPTGRTQDLGALLDVIDAAEDFVYVAVMSYLPTTEFSRPERFWPAIDDRLRKAAFERRVKVRLLAGCWRHSRATMFPFLKSLAAVADNRTGYSVEVVGVVVVLAGWCFGGVTPFWQGDGVAGGVKVFWWGDGVPVG
uniref:5'-3' exonuclease PLD3 n=1 Tax=Calidris pygmaea TaxID=425635 RepID=A0A8C3KU17_9CHAR